IQAFSFELGKVKSKSVQKQVVDMFANVSRELAKGFAEAINVEVPDGEESKVTKSSKALSQENTIKKPATRKVGVIVGNGYKGEEVDMVLTSLKEEGIQPEVISDKLGIRKGDNGSELEVDHAFLTGESVLFD
ncbi:hypothetical protein R0J90_12520, partial [Micrococcus sp. SIMBA_144]